MEIDNGHQALLLYPGYAPVVEQELLVGSAGTCQHCMELDDQYWFIHQSIDIYAVTFGQKRVDTMRKSTSLLFRIKPTCPSAIVSIRARAALTLVSTCIAV